MADVVMDASALVDLLLGEALGAAVEDRLAGHTMHAPAHADAEVLSALGRTQRAGDIEPEGVAVMLAKLTAAPIVRHPLPELLAGTWARRHQLRLTDALYVELAVRRSCPLLTTDRRLREQDVAEVVHTG